MGATGGVGLGAGHGSVSGSHLDGVAAPPTGRDRRAAATRRCAGRPGLRAGKRRGRPGGHGGHRVDRGVRSAARAAGRRVARESRRDHARQLDPRSADRSSRRSRRARTRSRWAGGLRGRPPCGSSGRWIQGCLPCSRPEAASTSAGAARRRRATRRRGDARRPRCRRCRRPHRPPRRGAFRGERQGAGPERRRGAARSNAIAKSGRDSPRDRRWSDAGRTEPDRRPKLTRWLLLCTGLYHLVDIPSALAAGVPGAVAVVIGLVLATTSVAAALMLSGPRRRQTLYVLAAACSWPAVLYPALRPVRTVCRVRHRLLLGGDADRTTGGLRGRTDRGRLSRSTTLPVAVN